MNTKHIRLVLAGVLFLIIGTTVYTSITNNRTKPTEIIQSETLQCVISVCVKNNAIGNECEVFPSPVVSKVLIVVDKNDKSYKHVIVEPTTSKCQ